MNHSRSPVAFGRYIITRRIARGGMAEIYRARTRSTATKPAEWVAIKMMRSTLGHEELRERLFEREVRIATRLHHANVVPVYECGQELGRPYLAMEYVRGRDLAHLLKPNPTQMGPMPFELGMYIGLLAARGLGHAHRLRDEETNEPLDIVHRDMSPGNVIVGYDGTVKVLDFGVARINETQGYQTQTGTLRGKFAYMSPEQTRGEELDARSDVFSFGTVLYELLTGSNCFRDKNPISTLERVQGMRPVPPSRALRIIPKDVDRILAQCLSKDRRRRFPDAEAVAEAIEDYLSKRGFDGQTALVEYMATTFSWEQHEEASELAREEEEVALMEVVEFVPDLTNDGLDSHRIAVTTNEEASSSEVRQVKVGGDAGGAVFEEEGGAARSSANVLSEDMPLKRGRAVQASSLLAEAEDGAEASAPGDADIDANAAAGLASPSAPRQLDADEEPTAHIVAKLAIDTAADVAPLPPPEASPPWYANTMAIAGVTAVATLSVALLIFSQQSGGFKSDGATPIAPVTIRLPGESTGGPSNQPLAAVSVSTAARGQKKAADRDDASASPTSANTSKDSDRTPKRNRRPKRRRSRSKKVVTGFLNVGARPWAEITIDGKRWPYQTPQAGIELPVGKHVVILHNPKTGVTKRTAVYIKHGKYRTVNLDLRR